VSQSTSTGSFWRCPSCQKAVPSRQETCRCGFERSQAPKLAHEVRVGAAARAVGKPERTRPQLRGILGAFVTVVLLGGSGYWAYRSWKAPAPPAPEDSELARKIREGREARAKQQQPQIVYIPVPGSKQPQQPAGSVPVAAPSGVPVQPSPPSSMSQGDSAPPTTLESEIDAKLAGC
jgi:hypothetical protein